MRVIDADALKEKAWDADTRCGYVQVVDVGDIDNAPTIDVPVRKVGKWINDRGLYKCSVCDELLTGFWAVVCPEERMYKEMKYCPNCGAKMERSEE